VGTEIDIRRVLKYPPESFLSAIPTDLLAGENKVAEYIGFAPNILVLQGFSFSRTSGLKFAIDADKVSSVVELRDLGSVKGLDKEEAIKLPITLIGTMKITAPSATTAYQWRHRVTVFRPTVLLKMQLGLRLTDEEVSLAEKYGLSRLLSLAKPTPYDIWEGIEEWRTVSVSLSSSGTLCRVLAPKGKKVILAGISATRPSSPASAYLTVNRDGTDGVLNLDLYCLPSLDWEAPVRVVSLEKLEVKLDVKVSGTYNVRVTYGIGRLTLPDKIRWGLDLTAEERRVAEEENLFERVRVGLA
jgi:hypothetical protein